MSNDWPCSGDCLLVELDDSSLDQISDPVVWILHFRDLIRQCLHSRFGQGSLATGCKIVVHILNDLKTKRNKFLLLVLYFLCLKTLVPFITNWCTCELCFELCFKVENSPNCKVCEPLRKIKNQKNNFLEREKLETMTGPYSWLKIINQF